MWQESGVFIGKTCMLREEFHVLRKSLMCYLANKGSGVFVEESRRVWCEGRRV